MSSEEKQTVSPAGSISLSQSGTLVDVRALTVQAGDKILLDQADATFPAGKVTLLLGCSGVGKSVLLKILAGLIEEDHSSIRYSGSILFRPPDQPVHSVGDDDHPVAVVFQNFALLDELTPTENVRIALDHSRQAKSLPAQRAKELLSELRVPTDRSVSVLSGGQQQRLAIARALAPRADVVLYDEPTSGLDARTAHQVAELIQETHERHRRTAILVTHDHETLRSIADHIILLDHRTKKLVELPRESWDRLTEALGQPPESNDVRPSMSLMQNATKAVSSGLESFGRFAEEIAMLPLSLLPLWKSLRWGLRYTGYYLRLVAGFSACLYIVVACMILGYVAQDFVFRYLPFRQHTEPLLGENLLHATGFSIYRFLVPILSTILIAARSGAAVSADLGSKVYGHQLDALKTLGANPNRLLRTPILYAFLLGTPFLSMLGYYAASISAGFAFLLTHPEPGIAFWDAHFHKELIQPTGYFYKGAGWLTAKLLTCGAGIALISWQHGSAPKLSSAEISRGVTRTILWATLFVLSVHFLYSLFEFQAQK